jgi:glutamate-1-semialdehyde 2,1-aminomutase
MRSGLREIAQALTTPVSITGDGPCAGIHFTAAEVTDYATARSADQRKWRMMCAGMALAGFSLSSRTFGPILPFTDADIEITLEAFRETLTAIDNASGGSE